MWLRHAPYDAPPPPPAPEEVALTVRYLGVTGYEISDGQTTLVLDPMVNRWTLPELLTGPLEPDPALSARWVPEADYVLVNHAHFDHVIDAPEIALRTGAEVVGSASVANLMRSRGGPEGQLREVSGGEELTLGSFQVRVVASTHGSVLGSSEPMPGTIAPDAGPLWFYEYTQDQSLSYRIEAGGASIWFHPSAVHRPGELGGQTAGTLIVGVNNADASAEGFRALAAEAGAARVIPSHFDNFFQPIDQGLGLFPGLDMDGARAALTGDSGADWIVLGYDQVVALPPD